MKILIADDHYLIRDGLKRVIQNISTDINIFEANNSAEILSLISNSPQFDVILLDLRIPVTDGFSFLVKLTETNPGVLIVIHSAADNLEHMIEAFDSGAVGFIPKSTPYEELVNAIKLVLSGGVYVPKSIFNKKYFPLKIKNADVTSFSKLISIFDDELTARQREVLLLLCEGQQNKEIAKNLGLSEHTVKVHITAVFRSLGVSNRTQAVLAVKNLRN